MVPDQPLAVWPLCAGRALLRMLAVLMLFALLVKWGAFRSIDAHVGRWVGSCWTPEGERISRAVTFFGSTPWLLIAGGLMSGWWMRQGHAELIGLFWGGIALGLLVQGITRLSVLQWRPESQLAVLAASSFWPPYEFAGFPSGHAFRSAYLCAWWSHTRSQQRGWWASLAVVGCQGVAFGVGITRVYLNRHWMTDVLGGWLVAGISYAAAWTWWLTAHNAQRQTRRR